MSSYAVPFEEENRDPNVWFVDHNYHEELAYMHNKVNAKEKVVGWYLFLLFKPDMILLISKPNSRSSLSNIQNNLSGIHLVPRLSLLIFRFMRFIVSTRRILFSLFSM